MDVLITEVTEITPPVRAVIERQLAHGAAHYPAESNHELDPADYLSGSVRLFAAWRGGSCTGIVALKRIDAGGVELKSMHVVEEARGAGLAGRLLDRVIREARAAGFTSLWLETGSRPASAAARRLYERAGFRLCPPFGGYREDPESVFMVMSFGPGA